jgi:hypothetical protein
VDLRARVGLLERHRFPERKGPWHDRGQRPTEARMNSSSDCGTSTSADSGEIEHPFRLKPNAQTAGKRTPAVEAAAGHA